MTIKARIQKLEARRPANRLENVPVEALRQFDYLASKWFAAGSLDASEQADLLEITAKYGILRSRTTVEEWEQLIEAERSCPELSQQRQSHINEFARSDPAYRPFATEKTWSNDFHSPSLAARWRVEIEQSNLPKKKRQRAADLLRRRSCNLRLQSADVVWLTCVLLEALDLAAEREWLTDHLEGGHTF